MKKFDKLTETEIIERILNGEKALYELIVRRFNPHLYKIGRSYNYNHQDTEDLMQETFIAAYNSLSQFEARASFKTWIIRIMMNNCYRKRGKSSYKNEIMQDAKEHSIPLFTNKDNQTSKLVQNRELGNIIEKALERIPIDYRIVFSLREINGLNVCETAQVLNISKANVKVRLSRAKAMLRSEIENAYSASELFEFNLKYCDTMVDIIMKKIDGF